MFRRSKGKADDPTQRVSAPSLSRFKQTTTGAPPNYSVQAGSRQYRQSRIIPNKMLHRVLIGIMTLIGIGWGVSVVWGVWVGWLSGRSWSRLQKIEVVGLDGSADILVRRLKEDEIIRAASIGLGANLMELSLDSVADRVKDLPGVKRARVLRRLPGRLYIAVEERRPIAMVIHPSLALIDEEGVIFPLNSDGEIMDLPVIIDAVYQNDDENSAGTLDFITQLYYSYKGVYRHLGEVYTKTEDGDIEIRLRQGNALIRAKDIRNTQTLRVLESFLLQQGNRLPHNLKYIDLRGINSYKPGIIVTGVER